MKFIRIAVLMGVVVLSTMAWSQNIQNVKIEWDTPEVLIDQEQTIIVPKIKGQPLDGRTPLFFFKQKVGSSASNAIVTITSTEPAPQEDINYLNRYGIEIGELDYQMKLTNAGKDRFLVIEMFPYYIQNGNVLRVKEFQTQLQKGGPTAAPVAQKDFVSNSVLQSGSGDWYKFTVDKDGIFKLDKAFLTSLGINTSTLNPQHINIYGNGDGLLPESNDIPRTDDLAKNAIQIIGETDGSFDDNDYILFYGWGPHRWYPRGDSAFYQQRHHYSDVSVYFLNVNQNDIPLRIENVFESPSAQTHSITDYDYYLVHENDWLSLVNGGQRWYGELFDDQLVRTFPFNVSNVNASEPAAFQVSLASNVNNSGGTSQNYSIGGNQLFSAALPSAADFGRSDYSMVVPTPSTSMPLTISIVRNSPDVLTYLDKITLNVRRNLVFVGSQINFRDLRSVGAGNVAQFQLSNLPAGGFVWEVTNRHQPYLVQGGFSGSDYTFRFETDSLREFVASNGVNYFTPVAVGPVGHQNLHALDQADYLIVTHPNFIAQANRLADLHRAQGTSVHVVPVDLIYNEFSSGMQDATAIRMFAKMFYDRSVTLGNPPKHLLLFGDGTYDPKNRVPNNNNFILTFQLNNSANTEDHIGNMPMDDYFGMLDDSDGIHSLDLLDISVGRLLISDNTMAKQQVDKIEHYMMNGSNLYSTANTNCGSDNGSSTFGDWRTKYVLIADDQENNYFLNNDVEPQYEYVSDTLPEMNCEKVYLDAYQQISTAGGERYPDVNEAIDSKIERGALLVNYVGHGGEVGVAEERVITVPQIQGWRNIDVLPLMVSATCEFTKFDDPDRVSAGEWASINPYGAAIALMTTTRSVYFTVNTIIGQKFIRSVFQREADMKPRTFGEIIARTKNGVGGNNKRSFTLIGDPALRIALPNLNVVTDSINGVDPAIVQDTMKALSHVTIKGHLEGHSGDVLNSFNGVIYPTVFDKPKEQMTLGNDSDSPEKTFMTQTNKVYRGKASVTNGYFEFSFIVPKDINYSLDFGKISYYAENGVTDAFGFDTSFFIGGIDPNGINDTQGPSIDLFINDENFVNGGITDETPILIAKLFDENGINTVGNGVGHDLIGVLDGETGNPIVLNDFYTSDLDSYQSGEIRYNFAALEPGPHTLSVKVWDVNNNSSETMIEFVVQENENVVLDHVLNYPNPFTTYTEFFFEHNQVCNQLETQVQIFTVSGKLVRTINRLVHTEGFRSEGIEWDGRDDFGDQLAKGVYVYRLKVKTPDGKTAEKIEKLVILK